MIFIVILSGCATELELAGSDRYELSDSEAKALDLIKTGEDKLIDTGSYQVRYTIENDSLKPEYLIRTLVYTTKGELDNQYNTLLKQRPNAVVEDKYGEKSFINIKKSINGDSKFDNYDVIFVKKNVIIWTAGIGSEQRVRDIASAINAKI